MNKRRIMIAAVIVACLSLLSFGSLAYFTAKDTAHNVITSGGVEIELHEWADAEKATPFPEDGQNGVTPGTSVTKIVEVENTGASEAWIRISVEKAIQLAEGKSGDIDLSLLVMDIDTENWTEKDGWYYYNAPLASGETTKPLFTAVTFDSTMGNLYQESVAEVDISAQAVQKANNGETVLEAAGWPAE